MPLATLVAIVGMLVVAGIVSIRFVRLAVETPGDEVLGVRIGVTAAAIVVFVALPLFATWAIHSSSRSAPILVTIVGVLSAPQLLGYSDLVVFIGGIAGISAAIAIWLPSASKYRRDSRAQSAAS